MVIGCTSLCGAGGSNGPFWFWFLSAGFPGLNAGASGRNDEFPFSTVEVVSPTEPKPGIEGLLLKLGRVNPGFSISDCFGRVGMALFAGELPNPREGPTI